MNNQQPDKETKFIDLVADSIAKLPLDMLDWVEEKIGFEY
jgi:hypothetical protein